MPTKEIKEGNKAPDFTARDQNGKKVKLSSFLLEKEKDLCHQFLIEMQLRF